MGLAILQVFGVVLLCFLTYLNIFVKRVSPKRSVGPAIQDLHIHGRSMGRLEGPRQRAIEHSTLDVLALHGAKKPLNRNLGLGEGADNAPVTARGGHTHRSIQEQATATGGYCCATTTES